MKINLLQVPFSRYGSYMAIAELPEHWQGHGVEYGYYLKNVSGSANTPIAARIVFPISMLSAELSAGSLSLCSASLKYDLCFPDPETLLIRGSNEAAMTLDFMTESGPYDYIYEFDAGGKHCYAANCYKNNTSYIIWIQKGEIALRQLWREQSSEYSKLDISGSEGFLVVIKEVQAEWDGLCPEYDFNACLESVGREFSDFCAKYPDLPRGCEDLKTLGAFVNWSAYVAPRGFLTRSAMLMSKNHMTSIWSWDHCFNAIALSYKNPLAAWEQFMLMFDYQDESGRLPDSVNDSKIIWNYVKPPIHGWSLMKMLKNGMELSEKQLMDALSAMEKQTKWWLKCRDFDGDGLAEYVHGNDSGWDNSTAFSAVPPICTPDLQAFLIVQTDALSVLSGRLGMTDKSAEWKRKSDSLLNAYISRCFKDGLPIAFQTGGSQVENDSLLLYLGLILGDRLPRYIRQNMLQRVKTGGFMTDHGFATESTFSQLYRADGYWRGPIWAPSTVILCDGLSKCGETELARQTAQRFLEICSTSGFAENFNAITGEGLRDRAYTWTASGAFILAKEYLTD